jgi:hypothetical protein
MELEMKGFIRAITLALFVITPQAFSEDEMRDFYAEPGMNPFKTSAGQDVTENIDPFSGNVQLSYVDLSIPGNGGLDINIARYYNLPQSSPGYANPFGYGWTMHFGRITIGSGHASQLCGTGLVPGGDTQDNPSIEMPSGGRELLVRSSALNDGTYITRSNWKAQCIDPTDYTRGIVATAPDGTAYYMREYVFMQGEDGPAGEAAPTVETWLTNQIVDSYGNTLDLTYLSVASGMKLLARVDASDGRQVTFDYLDANNLPVTASSINARLTTIKANGQTWEYRYAPFSGGATGWGFVDHYELTAVVRPDGTSWNYDYGSTVTEPGYQRLTRVTNPTRATPWVAGAMSSIPGLWTLLTLACSPCRKMPGEWLTSPGLQRRRGWNIFIMWAIGRWLERTIFCGKWGSKSGTSILRWIPRMAL